MVSTGRLGLVHEVPDVLSSVVIIVALLLGRSLSGTNLASISKVTLHVFTHVLAIAWVVAQVRVIVHLVLILIWLLLKLLVSILLFFVLLVLLVDCH